MDKKQIVNIINFVRAVDPPEGEFETMKNQMDICRELGLRATFLFEYDAMSNLKFMKYAKRHEKFFEFGIWIEITRGNVLAAGETWRGRDQDWDSHGKICNHTGYDPEARKRLVDAGMNKFKELFGYYPKAAGAWAIDAATLKYMADKYGISAACNCKEQWGTDGYSLWGGYYGQAYYPSVYNSLCPAQDESAQINVPVFRMLGSDPVYQYDAGLDLSGGAAWHQPVITLEPAYTGAEGGGGVPAWIDWFFKENFNGKCLSFGYVQAGQEGFPWKQIQLGFKYQMQKIKELCDKGDLELMTLSRAGEWYKKQYRLSPPSAISADSDWLGQGRKSYWYCCKNYRINLYFEKGLFWIRDFYLYDQNYKERYLTEASKTDGYIFDCLPVMDGNRFSKNGVRAGLYPCGGDGGETAASGEPVWKEIDGAAVITVPTDKFGEIKFTFAEGGPSVSVKRNGGGFALAARVPKDFGATAAARDLSGELRFEAGVKDAKNLSFTYNGFSYGLNLTSGAACRGKQNELLIRAENGIIAAIPKKQ